MEKIIINEETPYEVLVGTDIYAQTLEEQFVAYKQVVLFVDSNVQIDAYLERKHLIYRINACEANKSIEEYQQIITFLLANKIDRKASLFVAIGGGITLDLVGYVAATYKRGVDLITIPTTLLAMVDVAVGSKNAINISGIKNCVGTFYSPKVTILDINFLETLDQRNYNNGMAEVIKHGAIKDITIINDLLGKEYNIGDVIIKSILVKKYFVETDAKDKGIRKALNFGHTYGHAIESYFNYEKYMHGEAVSIGMNIMFESDTLKQVCKKFNLPISDDGLVMDSLEPFMLNDKKNVGGNIGFVTLEELGRVKL